MNEGRGLAPEQPIAIVTGVAGGLGAAVAAEMVGEGATVVAVDLRAVDAAPGLEPVAADLGDWGEGERVVADTIARHGRVDILVNCAAILRRTELDDVAPDSFAEVFAVNSRAPLVLMRAALRDMERRGWGRIVNVTSIGLHTGGYSLTSALYEASKAALQSFTKTFARYAGPRGVLVNSVAPGGMRTQMLTAETSAEVLVEVERDIPLGRLADPTEVAGLVAYLASSRNTYASGATFDVNGGVAMP